MIVSLRFQSQLHRTRPGLLQQLEKSFIQVIEGYGGKVKIEQKLINAAFDRETIGFWLDIHCVLEAFSRIFDAASSELYGHVCIIGENIPEGDLPFLAQALPSGLRHGPAEYRGTGIWCANGILKALESFVDFEAAADEDYGFSQVQAIRNLGDLTEIQTREKKNSEKIKAYLKQGSNHNTIIVGDERIGKREGLYRYCEEQMKGFPPLLIRFKKGINAVTCFVDALTPEIKPLLEEEEGDGSLKNRIYSLGEVLFQERLRDELTDFTLKRGEQFFSLLIEAYRLAAERRSVKPMMILENIQDADPAARLSIQKAHFARPARERVRIYGTATELKSLEPWEELLPRIVKFTPEKTAAESVPALPQDLWEMGYCSVLLNRYFPPFLLLQLLAEEGKNPVMIEKSMSILSRLEAVDWIDFTSRAENALEKNAETVRALVRRRLLAWVGNFRLKPCYPLLTALADLDSPGDDNLVLDSICSDIMNGTFSGIDKAVQEGSIASAAGKENENALTQIIKIEKALTHGSRAEIEETFKDALDGEETDEPSSAEPLAPAVESGSPCIRARSIANAASYYLSLGDIRAASDSVKEAMLLSQNENEGRGLARAYRLFSLVQFINHQLPDAIEYFTFAMEHAEKSRDFTELSISAYYAAVVHFVYGNISGARFLAKKSRKAALEAVLPGWADRSRFLEGRLCFETGLYQEALNIFRELRAEPLGLCTEAFEQTVDAWIFRAHVYINQKAERNAGNGPDALLFETEAAFIGGNYRKVLNLTKKLEQTEEIEKHFNFIEQPDWRSGFFQAELFLFPMQDLFRRMIRTFRVLAVCHMDKKEHPEPFDRNEAIRELQRIMRDELPEEDPNDTFYLYSFYRILKTSGAPEVDMNTAISIAFKRLQKRASRIDNNEAKKAFLSAHYWNSALTEAAKEHKLI